MNLRTKPFKWQQEQDGSATAYFMGIVFRAFKNGNARYSASMVIGSQRPEFNNACDDLDEAKAYCETTLLSMALSNDFEPVSEPIADTLKWFKLAVPEPTDKNKYTQVGCHFEEFAEMLISLIPHEHGQHAGWDLINSQADGYKTFSDKDMAKLNTYVNKDELLDSLCDQIVTALGVGYMFGFDMKSAFAEVVRSNFSKFENGKPVFDENGKIKKGANYTPPQLGEFI